MKYWLYEQKGITYIQSATDGSFIFVDVGSWLKNLRLHKYGSLFSQLSYEEMLGLNEDYLESKVHVDSKKKEKNH